MMSNFIKIPYHICNSLFAVFPVVLYKVYICLAQEFIPSNYHSTWQKTSAQ